MLPMAAKICLSEVCLEVDIEEFSATAGLLNTVALVSEITNFPCREYYHVFSMVGTAPALTTNVQTSTQVGFKKIKNESLEN